jgi:hypothetical protein
MMAWILVNALTMVAIILGIVVQDQQAEPQSMPHLINNLLDLKLDTLNLDNHIVCGQLELQEYLSSNRVKEWQPKNPRHNLFHKIKYPDTEFYQGPWGPELLKVPKQEDPLLGRPGYIWCTESRCLEIRQWIMANLFSEK